MNYDYETVNSQTPLFYRAEPPKQGTEISAAAWDMAERLIRQNHTIGKVYIVWALRQVDKNASLITLKHFVEWKAERTFGFRFA